MLLFQVYIDLNPDSFAIGMEKADARFVALCFILGVTSWSSLCRLIRAETLKISQLGNFRPDYCVSSQSSSEPSLTPSNNGVER